MDMLSITEFNPKVSATAELVVELTSPSPPDRGHQYAEPDSTRPRLG